MNTLDINYQKLVSLLLSIDPDKIILFGSRANNTHKKTSDYDICVLKYNISHRRKFAQEIYKLLFGSGLSIDIIVETPDRFNQLKENPFLIYHQIYKNGKILYAKP